MNCCFSSRKWFHESTTMLIYTQTAYLLKILSALRITGKFRGHKYQFKSEQRQLFFYLLPNFSSYVCMYVRMYVCM